MDTASEAQTPALLGDSVVERRKCPVCDGPARRFAEAPGWGDWCRCQQCGHEFAHPLELPGDAEAIFSAAYSGRETRSGMQDFAYRSRQREALISDPSLWFWTPAFADVLAWLKRELEPGATVFEVGCGLGFFLHALRREGFEPIGADVAEGAVRVNRSDGFRVWNGSVDTVPSSWPEPDAVVAFFMLHHVPQPRLFLEEIRSRWPGARIAIGQYGPSMRDPVRSSPPRTLHRWTAGSLERALQKAGYECAVEELASTGVELEALGPLRGIQRRLTRFPRAFRLGKRIAVRVLPRLLKPARRAQFVLLAFGYPVRP